MRERAELMGGSLTVDTRPGAGTRIRVELPVIEEPPRGAAVLSR
jgi:signal transduction histidine kinase